MEINDAKDTISWEELRSFVSGFWKLTLKKMRKYWYLVLLVLFLPVIGFLTKSYFKETAYELKSTLGFQYSHQKIYGQLVSDLNYLLVSEDYDELNRRLATTEIDWKNISTIEAINIFGYRLEEDLGAAEYPFYLIVRGKKPDDLIACTEAVVNYFNTHFSIAEKQTLELDLLQRERVFYQKQLGVIDSLMMHDRVTQPSLGFSSEDVPMLISENGHLLDLQEKYMLKVSEIELNIQSKASNIKVMSYGVIKKI